MDKIFQYSYLNQAPIMIIYHRGMDISQRKILVKELNYGSIKAYCYLRRGIRNFSYENILSAAKINFGEMGLYRGEHKEGSPGYKNN